MIQLLEYLQAAHPMTAELEQEVRKVLKVRDMAKDKHWLRMGEISNHIVFIETGLMKSYTEIGDKEVIIWFHREFDAVIGVKSFFKREPSDIAIKTLEPTRIWYAEYADLRRIYERHPSFNINGRVITEHYYAISEEHVMLMHLPPRERYTAFLKLFPWLEGRIRDKEVAAYLGITNVGLSKIKNGR